MREREASMYPYLGEAIELIDNSGLSIEDLQEYDEVLQRAVDRIREALLSGIVSHKLENPFVELMSFPVAVIFIRMIGDSYLARRFALAESERAYLTLHNRNADYLVDFSIKHFGFEAHREEMEMDGRKSWIKVHFVNYLTSSQNFNEPKWKLVNRYMVKGYVYLTKQEFSRLIKEKIGKVVNKIVSGKVVVILPTKIKGHYNGLIEFYSKIKPESTVFTEVNEKKYPPCIKQILEKLRKSVNLSHNERFALGTFLIKIGVSTDDLKEMFTISPDYDEIKTNYQVDNLASKYNVPECATMKTNGVCFAGDDKYCAKTSHPLGYYAMTTWKPPKDSNKRKRK